VNDPKEVVRSGYDRIADRYDEWASSFESPELVWVDQLLSRLGRDADVLDLGCGGGRRPAQTVAAGHRYTGVDLSTVQIERARLRIPSGRFIVADATQLELAPESFDAVMSLFVFGHIPRSEQAALLERVHGWLRPGGWLLATMGTGGSVDEVEDDWLGAPMFFSHYGAKRNRALVREAGFELEEAVVEEEPEDRHAALFLWVVARRPIGDVDA
jgi:SAM-dependent methyltransferase